MTLTEARQFADETICHALYLMQWKQDRFAAALGVSECHCNRQIRGQEHLSFQRLLQIEDRLFWLIVLTALKNKFEVLDTTAPEIAHALSVLIESVAKHVGRSRMAKAQLPDGQQERRRSA